MSPADDIGSRTRSTSLVTTLVRDRLQPLLQPLYAEPAHTHARAPLASRERLHAAGGLPHPRLVRARKERRRQVAELVLASVLGRPLANKREDVSEHLLATSLTMLRQARSSAKLRGGGGARRIMIGGRMRVAALCRGGPSSGDEGAQRSRCPGPAQPAARRAATRLVQFRHNLPFYKGVAALQAL